MTRQVVPLQLEKFDKQSEKIKPQRDRRGGCRPGAGRKPGSRNKSTLEIKTAVLECFQRLGGVEFMQAWAMECPSDFFRLLGRLIPSSASITHEGPGLEELLQEAGELWAAGRQEDEGA